jgi:hypothetical protein
MSQCRLGDGLAFLLALAGVACNDVTEPVTAAELLIVAGDGQTTRRGQDVAQPLRVLVVGTNGQPLQSALVQWSVSQGTATVQPTQSATNSLGEAETNIMDVGTIGTVLVSARVPGPPAVTFRIDAVAPCLLSPFPAYTLGVVIRGVLGPFDCNLAGGYFEDLYSFSLTAQQAVAIRVRSDAFDAEAGLWTPDARTRAIVYDGRPREDALFKAILAPGEYVAGAGSVLAGATGPYEFSISMTLPSVDFCEAVVVVPGITIPQQLAPTDCARASVAGNGPFYEDAFWIALYAGESLHAIQSSTRFGPRLRLQRRSGALLADVDGSASGTARLDFTADSGAIYRITASSTLPQQTGEYAFTVSNPAAGVASAATGARVGGVSAPGSGVVLGHELRLTQSPNGLARTQRVRRAQGRKH